MKYYTKLELRYTTHGEIDENGDEDTNYYNHILTSKLFETEKEAINFGNELIEKNKWIEQYPGRTNQILKRSYGFPLVVYPLKNSAEVYISVHKIDESSMEEMNELLQIVNVPKL